MAKAMGEATAPDGNEGKGSAAVEREVARKRRHLPCALNDTLSFRQDIPSLGLIQCGHTGDQHGTDEAPYNDVSPANDSRDQATSPAVGGQDTGKQE